MAQLVSGSTCFDAWHAVATSLATGPSEIYNVLVVIDDPTNFDPAWLERFNPAAVSPRGDQVRDVANTLFPRKTWLNSDGRDEFYARYKRAHAKSRRKAWGTYFLRLISFGAKEINQLEKVVDALARWKNRPHAALTVHLSSAETDVLRPLGAPCWHFGEFTCADGQTLDLVVVYRNHDYFNKALGNFIGLSRLLEFVSSEAYMAPGRLVCHSVHAYFDSTKQQMRNLLTR